MIEKHVEQSLRKAVRDRDGLALKFLIPALAGVPDRIILMPGRRCAFAELKAHAPAADKAEKAAGVTWYPVYCINQLDQIGGALDEICAP